MVFSQPSTDGHEAPPVEDRVLEALVDYALLLGGDTNRDHIRDTLPADQRGRFDNAYAIGMVTSGRYYDDRRRKEDTKRAKRLEQEAKEELLEEERQALRGATDNTVKEFKLLSSSDLDDLPEADLLIQGFLVKESIVRLFGPPKHFKSFVMLDMAGCVGSGIPWHGNPTVQSKVLYVVAEGVRGIKRRVRAWEAMNKREMVGVHFYEKAVQIGDRKDVARLIATSKRGGYEFIILDTQARCTVGLEENSASEMGVVVAHLDVLKEVTGACVALVHHSGATGGRARGSTAILGALDAEFEVEKEPNMSVKLTTKAQKDLAEAPEVLMDLVTPGPGLSLAVKPRMDWYRARPEDLPPLPPIERAVLTTLDGFGGIGATMTTLGKALPSHDPLDLRRALGSLDQRGCIHMKGATAYVADKGRTYLRAAQATGDDDD